jgi:hypothetical protein
MIKRKNTDVLWIIVLILFIVYYGWREKHPEPVISPLASPVYAEKETIDMIIDDCAQKYTSNVSQKSRMKAIIHFLLYKESKHGADKQMGDGGLAGGPMQFHEPTYSEYRKIMMQKGLVISMGSRFSIKDSIETAVWAIANGRGNAWGPLKRGEISL